MQVKVCELSGNQLNYAVAICENRTVVGFLGGGVWVMGRHEDGSELPGFEFVYSPSTDWMNGGPLIERERIVVKPLTIAERTEAGSDVLRDTGWVSYKTPALFWITPQAHQGATPLAAAMRCYVAFKLGDEVDVPDELCK